MLQPLDIAIILGWLSLTFVAGLWFSKRASTSTNDFFVTDRSLPWWVVGTSMVATTFAADTPLAVSGYVAAAGIGDNWKWWFTGVGALCTVFLFARLWRRAEVVTEAELVELRYGGPASRVLRAVKALWFGVFMNMLVVAWVMRAMRKVVEVVLGIGPEAMMWGVPTSVVIVVILFCLAVAYTGTAGLWGVVATDVIQFVLAMTGSVILAILSWRAAGGLAGIQTAFTTHGFDWTATTTLVPLNDPSPDGATLKFVLLMGVMWWAARNVDGGSYLAQRLFSAKDENHALWGYLWFTVANICVRPWPWIIVGLCGMAVLGPLEDPETYYPRMMVEVLPAGLFGLLVASFLAAFMSTIDTQLHWGASLLINDIYRRFLKPHAPDAHMLKASRVAVGLLAVVGAIASFLVEDIRFAWELALAITAGIGAVNIGRWYWWRVNAYSEFAAMGMAALGTLGFKFFRTLDVATTVPQGWLSFPFDAVVITAMSLPVWIAVTLLTAPGEREHLRAFYRRVRPGGPGWRAVAGDIEGFENDGPGRGTFLGIVAGCFGIYGVLLGMGSAIVGRWQVALLWGVIAAVATLITARQVAHETARNT
jgi:Na+/proline symporter